MKERFLYADLWTSSPLSHLHEKVAEAAAWCEANAVLGDNERCLRKLENPLDTERFGILSQTPDWLVRDIDDQRTKALLTHRIPVSPIEWDKLPGRLLVYWPEDNTSDGGAASVTTDFFDIHNTPPWDTWVSYFIDSKFCDPLETEAMRGYVLAYIPAAFVDLVEEGIGVNPEYCIMWLEDSKTTLSRILAEAGYRWRGAPGSSTPGHQ
ncbi:hypothetical protein JGU66_05820 [Myxococcaceae bacterium JPH2]|nr:hypothetical protein [Myxococcaceae bacterium JPH2]